MAQKPGRKAKPTALKLIDGNPGNRPINEHEPKPAPVYEPEPPTSLNEAEATKWREVSKKLATVRVLTELDLDALEIYCREWVSYHTALADLAERGKMLEGANGGQVWNPSWTQYKQSLSVCRSIMAEFGMTPSTRTGLVADADDTGKNRWNDF